MRLSLCQTANRGIFLKSTLGHSLQWAHAKRGAKKKKNPRQLKCVLTGSTGIPCITLSKYYETLLPANLIHKHSGAHIKLNIKKKQNTSLYCISLALHIQYSLVTNTPKTNCTTEQLWDLHIVSEAFIKTHLYIIARGCVVTHQADQKAAAIQHWWILECFCKSVLQRQKKKGGEIKGEKSRGEEKSI